MSPEIFLHSKYINEVHSVQNDFFRKILLELCGESIANQTLHEYFIQLFLYAITRTAIHIPYMINIPAFIENRLCYRIDLILCGVYGWMWYISLKRTVSYLMYRILILRFQNVSKLTCFMNAGCISLNIWCS